MEYLFNDITAIVGVLIYVSIVVWFVRLLALIMKKIGAYDAIGKLLCKLFRK